jgi:hypothetical protein
MGSRAVPDDVEKILEPTWTRTLTLLVFQPIVNHYTGSQSCRTYTIYSRARVLSLPVCGLYVKLQDGWHELTEGTSYKLSATGD